MTIRDVNEGGAYRRTLGRASDFEIVVVSLFADRASSVSPVFAWWGTSSIQRERRDDGDLGQESESSEFDRELHRNREY